MSQPLYAWVNGKAVKIEKEKYIRTFYENILDQSYYQAIRWVPRTPTIIMLVKTPKKFFVAKVNCDKRPNGVATIIPGTVKYFNSFEEAYMYGEHLNDPTN